MNRTGWKWSLLVGTAVLLAGGGAVLFTGWRPGHRDASNGRLMPRVAAKYRCPMHPAMVSDRPDDCPICSMRMVPVETDTGTTGAPAQAAATVTSSTEPGTVAVRTRRYRSTMNPSEVSDHPGKDSMGMEMVPVDDDEPATGGAVAPVEGRAAVTLSAQKRQLIGVRTVPVTREPFVRTIRAVGRVTYDEARLRHVHTKVAGWVERLYANTTGQLVKAGDPLLSIYSPDLVASAREYLLARQARDRLAGSEMAGDSGERLLSAARERLLLFDLTPRQIADLEKAGEVPTMMTLHAAITGYILNRNVTQGERIEPGMNLLDIADLSRVWVEADVYEYELPFVRVGDAGTMTLSYLPGRTFQGRITLVSPVLTEATRTVKVRLELDNRDLVLKPEMFAQVDIHANLGERLAVPDSAVISTGQRNLVFVDRGEGNFVPREVTVGVRLPDRFEILSGLSAGEKVLVAGNFLVDSEAKLKAALATASGSPDAKPAGGAE